MKKYSDEIVEIIISNINKTSTELSKTLNIPASTIRNIRRRNGIDLSFKIDEQKLIEFYDSNKSVDITAKKFKIERHTCSKILRKNGIKTSKKIELEIEQTLKIELLCRQKSYQKVSKITGLSSCYIQKLNSKNLTSRKKVIRNDDNPDYERYFDKINEVEKAYFLGFLAADGCVFIRENKNALINLTVANKDKYILELFFEKLGLKKAPYENESTNCCIAQVASSYMASSLSKYNIKPKKTWSYIPKFWNDNELNFAFIRGYFDGDGSISLGAKTTVSFCGNYLTMMKFKEFFSNFNIKTSLIEDKRKYTEKFYMLSFIGIKDKYLFLKLIYENKKDVFLIRKYEKAELYFERVEKNFTNRVENKRAVELYSKLRLPS